MEEIKFGYYDFNLIEDSLVGLRFVLEENNCPKSELQIVNDLLRKVSNAKSDLMGNSTKYFKLEK